MRINIKALGCNLISKRLTLRRSPRSSTHIVWRRQLQTWNLTRSLRSPKRKLLLLTCLKKHHQILIWVLIKQLSLIGKTARMTFSMRKNPNTQSIAYLLVETQATRSNSQMNSLRNWSDSVSFWIRPKEELLTHLYTHLSLLCLRPLILRRLEISSWMDLVEKGSLTQSH